MCSGLIDLIPKGGGCTLRNQWRPIALLSSVYKILARLLSARLQPLMPTLIHGSQTGIDWGGTGASAFKNRSCMLWDIAEPRPPCALVLASKNYAMDWGACAFAVGLSQ